MSGGDHLVVDGRLLEATSRSLSTIQQALSGLEARRGGAQDVWGHREVAAAMDAVVDNWDERRSRLSEKVDAVRQMTDRCSTHFGEIECSLSTELRQATPSTTTPARVGPPTGTAGHLR